jgi:glycosyltransferase involved in cell wall biosynthesis
VALDDKRKILLHVARVLAAVLDSLGETKPVSRLSDVLKRRLPGVRAIEPTSDSAPPRFVERGGTRWRFHSAPGQGTSRINHARGANAARRRQVLIIDHRLPSPDRDSGSLRMMELIRGIRARGHSVTFIPNNLIAWEAYLQAMDEIGVEVVSAPAYRSVADYLTRHGREFKLVILSRVDIAASHMATVRRLAPQAVIAFDTVDLHFVREEREARVTRDASRQTAIASRKQQEIQLVMTADLTIVVSPIEKGLLEAECPGTEVRIIPNIYQIDQADPPGFDCRRDIVFIGGFDHAPNGDAVLYFAREIFPRVRSRVPEAVFQVVGPYPSPEILDLASPSIQILGHVPDVRPIFDRARVSVAPLRFGAGVKGKVNQSLLLGVPAVVTSVAAEGMYLVHEESAMIADSPQDFADAVVRVCTSEDLWKRLSLNGRQNVADHFSIQAAARAIDELLEWAGLKGASEYGDSRLVRVSRLFSPKATKRPSRVRRQF